MILVISTDSKERANCSDDIKRGLKMFKELPSVVPKEVNKVTHYQKLPQKYHLLRVHKKSKVISETSITILNSSHRHQTHSPHKQQILPKLFVLLCPIARAEEMGDV